MIFCIFGGGKCRPRWGVQRGLPLALLGNFQRYVVLRLGKFPNKLRYFPPCKNIRTVPAPAVSFCPRNLKPLAASPSVLPIGLGFSESILGLFPNVRTPCMLGNTECTACRDCLFLLLISACLACSVSACNATAVSHRSRSDEISDELMNTFLLI